MTNIPKEIAQRCTFETRDQITRVTQIQPTTACEYCNTPGTDIFRYRIGFNVEPFAHRRIYCFTCKRTSVDCKTWYENARDLNETLRQQMVQNNREKNL